MRVVKYDRYDPTALPVAVQARAWQILWAAVNNHPAGNREQTQIGNRVFNILQDASEIVSENRNGKLVEIGRRLKSSGTESYFEDAEWRLLASAVEGFRSNILIGGSEPLIWVDKLLDSAPEISRKDYIAKVKKIKLEPAEAE